MMKSPAKIRKYENCFNIGFTLIELLIVIAILGGLATIMIMTFPASQRRAKDARRRSDLKQYQVALEVFANANGGFYPSYVEEFGYPVSPETGLCGALSSINCRGPDDPLYPATAGWPYYKYQSNGTDWANPDATQYVLWTRIEDVGSCGTTATTCYWILCSNGKSGVLSSVSTTGGDCPAGL